jgi:hypothetical protein
VATITRSPSADLRAAAGAALSAPSYNGPRDDNNNNNNYDYNFG